jgi:carotenoid cleavage dioxygenase-like enzyme
MVLLKQFDAKNRQDTFLFFDAFDITRGPIAQLPLRDPLPPGFHACFEPSNVSLSLKL